jgi:hypothetical protein
MSRSIRVAVSLGGVLLFCAATVGATDREVLDARIPFPFRVGSAYLPAGQYELRFDDVRLPGTVELSSQKGDRSVFALVQGTDPLDPSKETPTLRFRNHGGRYVLARVSDPGTGFAVQLLGAPQLARPGEERATAAE